MTAVLAMNVTFHVLVRNHRVVGDNWLATMMAVVSGTAVRVHVGSEITIKHAVVY
ncbi:MAG: hypothetical protein QXT73_06580 [Candidatus Methanomethylicaceae archaeon]